LESIHLNYTAQEIYVLRKKTAISGWEWCNRKSRNITILCICKRKLIF